MATLRRLVLSFLLLVIGGISVRAADFGENRDFNAAVAAFNDGVWWRAETEFGQFIAKHPKSPHVPEAVLLQAQAQYCQATNQLALRQIPQARQKFGQVVALLTARLGDAGTLTDEYLYWTGEAQFQNANYSTAADAFGRVAWFFPRSARRLSASVGEAAARAKLGEWSRVVELLQKPNGAFQQAAKTNPGDESTARGYLLLAEAELTKKDFSGAEAALQRLEARKFGAELDWRRQYLLCRVYLGAGKTEDALNGSQELLVLAEAAGRRDLIAESVALRAEVLERLGRRAEAMDVFTRNFASETPVERQRQALLKVSELGLALDRSGEAVAALEKYLNQFSNAPAADAALLALGELHLKKQISPGQTNAVAATTNDLQSALTYFDRLINTYSNSPLVGRAELDRGWSFWVDGKIPESFAAFEIAVARLPPSEDLAVARFKLADAQFAQKDFAGALENYHAARDAFAGWPRLKGALNAQSLYQILRASCEMTNVTEATNALEQILQLPASGDMADNSVLLVGQMYLDASQPAVARAVLQKYLAVTPDSPRRAEVDLIIARTFEQQGAWTAAITNYDGWLERFKTHPLQPQAEFYRALANYQAGRETNALAQFTEFVTRFPTNHLAPTAQWWIADYFNRAGDFLNAEKNYKKVFNDWPDSELAYKARMMAGQAAVGRQGFTEAMDHFTNLTSNLKCPRELRAQAAFAYGDVLMNPAAGTNRLANLKQAIEVFKTIPESNSTNELAALAWGEMANCYRQIHDTSNAVMAFTKVMESPVAKAAARSQAQVGLGMLQEELAGLESGDSQKALLESALNNYFDVFYEKNLRSGEQPDWFWVERAGLEAARVAETMQDWTRAVKFYQRLGQLLPPLKESMDRKIQKAQEQVTRGKS